MDEERIYRTERMREITPYIALDQNIDEVYRELSYQTIDSYDGDPVELVNKIHTNLNTDRYPIVPIELIDKINGYKADTCFVCSDCGNDFEEKDRLVDHLSYEHGISKDDITVYEKGRLENRVLCIEIEDDNNQDRVSMMNIPLTDGELIEMAIYSMSDQYSSKERRYERNDRNTDTYLPENFSKFNDLKKAGEIIRGQKFELTRMMEEYKLKEDGQRVFLSILCGTIRKSEPECFPSRDKTECWKTKDIRKHLDQNMLYPGRGYIYNYERFDIEEKEFMDIMEKLFRNDLIEYDDRRSRREMSREIPNYHRMFSVSKKSCSRLLEPLLTEEQFKKDEDDNSLFDRFRREASRGRGIPRPGRRHSRYGKKEKKKDKVPDTTFEDVILPEEMLKKINRVLLTDEQSTKLYDDFGFKDVMDTGKGTVIMFTGPSGTGKTHTSKAIANRVEKPLYKMDFSEIINCYLGETESNVSRAFEECEEEGKVLLIDECDAILSRRGQSRSGAGKAMERVVNVLLQRLEDTDLTVIMTTNLSTKLDKALKRRIDLGLKFPIPNAELRESLWRNHIPDDMELDEEVDLVQLADKYKLTGGDIKNAVFNAAKMVVKDGLDKIYMKHLEEMAMEEEKKRDAMDYDLNEDDRDDDDNSNMYA